MAAPGRLDLKLKRAYDAPSRSDGDRVLVERLWPRGVSKQKLQLAAWLKDVAPSAELRKWFGHDPAKWHEFKKRYFQELDEHSVSVQDLLARIREGAVTLVFAAKDMRHNNAVALKGYLELQSERSKEEQG